MVTRSKYHTEYLQLLGATAKNLFATAFLRPGFVYLCYFPFRVSVILVLNKKLISTTNSVKLDKKMKER